MNLILFISLLCFIKKSNQKPTSDDNTSDSIFFHNNSIKKEIPINELNYCEGCCDDLNFNESKSIIENHLDLDFFNTKQALKIENSNLYEKIKTCVFLRPLISCVDLCLCKNEKCIDDLFDYTEPLFKAFNCTKSFILSSKKFITLYDLDQNDLGLNACWNNLNEEQTLLIKLKLIDDSATQRIREGEENSFKNQFGLNKSFTEISNNDINSDDSKNSFTVKAYASTSSSSNKSSNYIFIFLFLFYLFY